MNLPHINWADLLTFSASPLEIMIRGTAVYWFLFVIFRFLLRRGANGLGVSDFLFVVIVADASQNAMSGQTHTVFDGLLLVASLVFWDILLDFLSYRFERVRRFAEPAPLLLVKNGKMLRKNMRREYITEDEIKTRMREKGVASLADIKAMYVEFDGEISLLAVSANNMDSPTS